MKNTVNQNKIRKINLSDYDKFKWSNSNIILIIFTFFPFGMSYSAVSIAVSGSVASPFDFGTNITIPKLVVTEQDTSDFVPTGVGKDHIIRLTAPLGFVFSSMDSPESSVEGDFGVVPVDPVYGNPANTAEISFKIKAGGVHFKDSIIINNIVLEPANGSTYVYDEELYVTVEFYSNGATTPTVSIPLGPYSMVQPEIAWQNEVGSICENDTIGLFVSVTNTSSTLSDKDELIVEYVLEGFTDSALTRSASLHSTEQYYNFSEDTLNYSEVSAIRITAKFESGWEKKKTLTIGDSTKNIYRKNVEPILLFKDQVVTAVYETREYLRGAIYNLRYGDPNRFTISAEDPNTLFMEDHIRYAYFRPDVAGPGLHKVFITLETENTGCISKDTLVYNVTPDMITAEPVYCYGHDLKDTIKISTEALRFVDQDSNNSVSTTFHSLEIRGYGHSKIFTPDSALPNPEAGYKEFEFQPSKFIEDAVDSDLNDISIQMIVLAKVEATEYNYFCSDVDLPDHYCYLYKGKTDCDSGQYRCREETVSIQKVGEKISTIVIPRNDGWLLDSSLVYCQGKERVRLRSNRTIDTIRSELYGSSIVFDNGDYSLDLGYFSADSNTTTDIVLEYYDANSCLMDTVYTPTIYAVPQVGFEAGPVCNGTPQHFSQYSPDSQYVNIVRWDWDFGDGFTISSFSSGADSIEAGAHGGNTYGTYKEPFHLYTGPGEKSVVLGVMSEQGCTNYDTATVVIGKYPGAGITFGGKLEGKETVITNLTDTTEYDTIVNFIYTIEKPSGEIVTEETSAYSAYAFIPDEHGVFRIGFSAESNNGCVSEDDTLLPVFPVVTVNNQTSYAESFSTESMLPDGWLHSKDFLTGQVSVWKSVPVEGKFNDGGEHSGGYLWVSGDPKEELADENGWLESPCFQVNELDFPMISMDIFQSMRAGQNGAVVQYTLDDGASWDLVGEIGGGDSWYNTNGIISAPGGQTGANIGWSNDNEEWETARYPLDFIREENEENNCVRFRVEYEASGASAKTDTLMGFGFNDFYIGQRKRAVLIEQFLRVNKNGVSDPEEEWLNNFVESNPKEVFAIKYHLGDAGFDPELYMINWRDIAGRATEYYLFSAETMASVLDGEVKVNAPAGDQVKTAYSTRVLSDPDFGIYNVNMEAEGNGVRFTADIKQLTNGPKMKFGEAPQQFVRMAVVQTDYAINGVSYKDVLVELLPTGEDNVVAELPEDMEPGDTIRVSDIWVPNVPVNGANFKLVIFVQTQASYNEVHQVWFDTIPSSLIGGISPVNETVAEGGGFRIYPNPIDEEMLIVRGYGQDEQATWELFGASGEMVLRGEVHPGVNEYRVNTSSIVPGMYILRIKTHSGKTQNKKVIKCK